MKTVEQILDLIKNGTWIKTEELGETEAAFFEEGVWCFGGWQGMTWSCEDVTITHCEGFDARYTQERFEIKRHELEPSLALQISISGKNTEIPCDRFWDVIYALDDKGITNEIYGSEITTQFELAEQGKFITR